MPLLGHRFSQRRKSSNKPRDLHIRKVSFSGCSLSSGCSFPSSSSMSTARAPSERVGSAGSGTFEPPSLHPTFQPPPRLYNRPLIYADSHQYEEGTTFFDDDDTEEDDSDYELTEREVPEQQRTEMELPPRAPIDHVTRERQEPQEYFLLQLTKRPPIPLSRWSESTVHTLDQLTPAGTPDGVSEPEPLGYRSPNFSYKRATVPKRPTMRVMDTFDNYIKRGRWKRRGILFNSSEMDDKDEADSGLAS